MTNKVFLIIALFAFLHPEALFAAEPPWLSLLRSDSLIGWDYGERARGWMIEDGVLQGSADSATLLSGYSVGDFELRFDFQTEKNAAVELLLIGVESGKEHAVTVNVPGGTGERRHPAYVRREGRRVRVGKDTNTAQTMDVGEEPLALGLRITGGRASIADLQFREPVGEPLFNGRDLSGWWTPGKQDAWHAENGEIVKRGGGGNYLRTEQEFANFVLSLEYKANKGNNSGIGIRTAKSGWPSGDGMELQLLDHAGTDKGGHLSIYRNVRPLANVNRSEAWNHLVIKADGYMISAWNNGALVQHHNTYRHPELKHRHLKGWIGIQDHGGVVHVRNIHLREMPDGVGHPVWTAPRTPRGAELVLDRIMNQHVLSQRDATASRFLRVKTKPDEEQVLAELKGPGAVVRIAHTNASGRLRFFFDGEAQPRIDCSVKDLKGRVPKLADHAQPLLTYVAFEQSLKIVLADATEGEYLLDVVAFPADGSVSVSTYSGPESSIPRGWLPSIDYRHNHYKYGQHRDNDPMPRESSGNKRIEPGSAAPLVSLEGAGIVHWTKLQAPQNALASEDLWIDIHIDGEKSPAISAPARYLYAAIHDGQRHNNLLMTHRGGYFSRLAMPYGAGLRITAVNKGKQPLSGIGMTVSYEPASDETRDEVSARMRLRSRFGDAASTQISSDGGRGRLIGLVVGGARPSAGQLDAVLADGKALTAFTNIPAELLLGANPGEQQTRRVLTGRDSELAWRYFLLAPVDFEESLVVQSGEPVPTLLLYYANQP